MITLMLRYEILANKSLDFGQFKIRVFFKKNFCLNQIGTILSVVYQLIIILLDEVFRFSIIKMLFMLVTVFISFLFSFSIQSACGY